MPAVAVLSREMVIPLPTDAVWAQLVDVKGWPLWAADIVESGWSDGGKQGEGDRLWFRMKQGNSLCRVEAEVSGYRERRELTYRPVGGDMPYTEGMTGIEWEWLLYARGSSRASLRFTLSYDAGGGMPFFRELVGTRVQVLNTADTSLRTLRALTCGTGTVGILGEA